MQLDHPEKKLIAHCQNGNKIPLNQIRDLNNDILILIGPEEIFLVMRSKLLKIILLQKLVW